MYVVDVIFKWKELDVNGLVVDIGLVGEVFCSVLVMFNYWNLDDELVFVGVNIIIEFLVWEIYECLVVVVCVGYFGDGVKGVDVVCVIFSELYVVWGSYEGLV